jgi:hypothetical protein
MGLETTPRYVSQLQHMLLAPPQPQSENPAGDRTAGNTQIYLVLGELKRLV